MQIVHVRDAALTGEVREHGAGIDSSRHPVQRQMHRIPQQTPGAGQNDSDDQQENLPAPFGRTFVMALPGIDVLIAPTRLPLRRVQTYFGMTGPPPPGFFPLVRLLKPHRRPWAYRLVKKLVSKVAAAEHAHALKKGIGPEGILKIAAGGAGKRLELSVVVPDGGVGSAYLPVLAAAWLAEGRLTATGLATAWDIISPIEFFEAAPAVFGPLKIDTSGPD